MKLDVTRVIDHLENGGESPCEAANLNEIGECCKCNLQAMSLQVFQSHDVIYKNSNVEEHHQKVLILVDIYS